jgi:hypothetical protein
MDVPPNSNPESGLYRVAYGYNPEDDDGYDDEGFHIGIFSSFEKAQEIVAHLVTQPGFRDHPKRLQIVPVVIDQAGWMEGFVPGDIGDVERDREDE